MSDYTEIVARVRFVNEHLNLFLKHGGIDSLCAAVETLERERDQSDADERLAVANADRMTDQVIALTAEVERLRGDAERLDWFIANHDKIEIGKSEQGWSVDRDNEEIGLIPIAAGLPDFRAAIDAARRALGGTDAT